MTIKTFWTIFIKVLGIWLVLESVTVIPQFLSTLFYVDSTDMTQSFALTGALLILTIVIYIFILRLFQLSTFFIFIIPFIFMLIYGEYDDAGGFKFTYFLN